MSVMLLHHHEHTFTDPTSFISERWRTENHTLPVSSSSAGAPGRCLGINLAYTELDLALAAIVRRFDLDLFDTSLADTEPVFDAAVPLPRADSKGV